ncbi:phenylalanine--tRNA ligase subunit beta [Leeia oryzae]|uniref:phenylalanine--tRNA ligase subunit beta n=1 Tax=Leeia oryzae TaxID=356662 RepID=UPI000475BFE7|nr:phenylalanine--tRNA ligase subunit beta [Leeia oryzae]
MQFSENWLRTFVNPDLSTDQLTHLLTMAGLEVEEDEPVGVPFKGVVVAEVISTEKHPNADRLNVCSVNVGEAEPVQIVCGAPNVRAGIKVPCARLGAALPGETADQPFVIAAVKMRGVDSAGMLCSAKELRLSDDHGGLLELPSDAPVGADVYEYLALNDHKITIKLTPNRADCLSLLGIARETAALTGTSMVLPAITPAKPDLDAVHPVTLTANVACGRFAGRVIRGVNANAKSPDWMVQRLERSGVRSISALVDVTNYVMLELGRPLHVYDQDKLTGAIEVRFAREGESLKLLNEQTITLADDVLLIADASGPIGLAGIMGGDSTKAELTTQNVFLESAFFDPNVIAGKARRFNFTSDAAHRFERGVDFENCVDGIERATQLILDICGGQVGPVSVVNGELPPRPAVKMRVKRAQRVIGVAISADEMASIFTRLGLGFEQKDVDGEACFIVTPPSYRFDILIEEDLIEEVARVYGFENIPSKPPVAEVAMFMPTESVRSVHALRNVLADEDYQEVINYSFVEAKWEKDFAANETPIALKNPIASHLSVMRSNLIGGLVANLVYNINRRAPRVRLFEVGKVFLKDASVVNGPLTVAGFNQPLHLAGLAWGPALPEQWGAETRQVDFFDVKSDVEALIAPLQASFSKMEHPALHPGRSAGVVLDGKVIGWLGELHPQLVLAYDLPSAPVVFELVVEPLQQVAIPLYKEVSNFPPVKRDLALVVDASLAADELLNTLKRVAPAEVTDVNLFDVYTGKGVESGKKSLAIRFQLHNTQKTLTDVEVDAMMDIFIQEASAKHAAQLR